MGIYKKWAATIQTAREVTKGTGVATIHKAVMDEFKITPNDAVYHPIIIKGTTVADQGNDVVVSRGVDWGLSGPVACDDIHRWCDMAVKGGGAATGAGPYVWTFTRGATGDPTLKSRTIELRLTDLSANSDWKVLYSMATKLEISAAMDEALKFNLEGFGRRIATATLTAAQAIPALVFPNINQCAVYIDSTWGTIGTTQITGQVLGWKWAIETGEMPIRTSDARTDLDLASDELNPANVKTSLEILMYVKDAGQWATEKTAAEARTLRAVKIATVAQAAPLRQIDIKGLFKHDAGSAFPDADQDGLQTMNLKLVGATDDTNFAEVIVTNGINSI